MGSSLLKANMFAFSLLDEGEFHLGGIDRSKILAGEDIHYIDVVNQYYWTVTIEKIRFGEWELDICANGCNGVIDSGTSLISFPT